MTESCKTGTRLGSGSVRGQVRARHFGHGRHCLPQRPSTCTPPRVIVQGSGLPEICPLIATEVGPRDDQVAASWVFWGGVLDFIEDPDGPNQPGDEECMIFSIDGTQRLLFIEVPDAKQVNNRVHLDLKTGRGHP